MGERKGDEGGGKREGDEGGGKREGGRGSEGVKREGRRERD